MLDPYQIHNPLFHIANPTLDYNLTTSSQGTDQNGLREIIEEFWEQDFSHAIDIIPQHRVQVINKYLPHKKCDHVGTGTSCLVCCEWGASGNFNSFLLLFRVTMACQFLSRVFIKFCCKNIEGGLRGRWPWLHDCPPQMSNYPPRAEFTDKRQRRSLSHFPHQSVVGRIIPLRLRHIIMSANRWCWISDWTQIQSTQLCPVPLTGLLGGRGELREGDTQSRNEL